MTTGFLATPLPLVADQEGTAIASSLPPVVDAHVHLFPDRAFAAIYRWFDRYGWPIRYRLTAPEIVAFLRRRGIHRVIGLSYAHRPGIARELNQFMAVLARDPAVTGLATVMPGEPDAVAIVREGFDLGLRGVKLHCHVQCFAPDAREVAPIYELCADRGLPVVVHAGREPKSPALRCDPDTLCSVDRIESVLREHPTLRLCVPHLGGGDYRAYGALLERYDNLWIDTAMILADYFPDDGSAPTVVHRLIETRPDRVMYGTDFPLVPYAWDRELRWIAAAGLPADRLALVLGENAQRFYGCS